MKTVFVTGCYGFLGRNLWSILAGDPGVCLIGYDLRHSDSDLAAGLTRADDIVHLAGVNRPPDPSQYEPGNAGFTRDICARLERLGRAPRILFSSSIQAVLDNPYGLSKRHAEEELAGYATRTGARVVVYRLKNLFGKWCRPNYNSVVATFCHNIAHDLPIEVHDPSRVLQLSYVDDVVAALRGELGRAGAPTGCCQADVKPSFTITLGELADMIRSFRQSGAGPSCSDSVAPLASRLYATYVSCLEKT